ncbi:hypothetical protein TNCT_426981 [Trichonephila clavata]|uniref:Uncharacterized protein n=1 Tax=Trichonephila clavata TaxID=2740835 RepID=A0A8X6IMZ7_TRICU|nr:hypothetical protein TNCT_426981 [Trichonephila clavata]
MDDKPCIPSADTELLTSEVTDSFKKVTSETDLSIQKSTRTPTEDISKAFLLQVISILKSLDADITNSIRISRKDMYLPNIPGMTSSGNSTTEEEDTVAESASSTSSEMIGAVDESAPSTSQEETGTVAKENPCENGTHSKCSTCSYFHQMDRLFDIQ